MIQRSILTQLQASNQTVEESSSLSMSSVVECIRTIASVYQLGCLGQQRPMPSSDFSTATSPALEGEPRAHLKSRGIRAQQISGRCTWPASCAVSFAPPTIEQQPGLSFQPNSNVTLHLPQSSLLLPLQPHPNSIDPSLFTRLYTTPSHQLSRWRSKTKHSIKSPRLIRRYEHMPISSHGFSAAMAILHDNNDALLALERSMLTFGPM